MPRRIRLFQVDAFTTQRFAGNPAGVVLDAQLLSDGEMQSLARELGNGDSAFVLPPDDAQHDIRVRFFTPRREAAFVGHATLAVHAVLHGLDPRPVRRQQGQTGTVEVTTLSAGGGFAIRQAPAPLGRVLEPRELHEVLALLGLQPAQLDPACPAQIVGAGSTRLLLGVTDSGVLDAARPQLEALGRMSATLGAQGYFVFTRRPGGGMGAGVAADTEARMFCPAIGIDEDPVSGNAHAMLGAYLVHHGLLHANAGIAAFAGVQGLHVGRPGRVSVELESAGDGSLRSTRIAGQAVVVYQSVLEL
jgi:PhzF family phenazine biosynthesis protein